MRYSSIEIPEEDNDFVRTGDPDYVKNFTLHSTKGDIEAFVKSKLLTYKGEIEGGIKVVDIPDHVKMGQLYKTKALLFVPESHPLFNAYVVKTIGVSIFTSSKAISPAVLYSDFLRSFKVCILNTIYK